MMQRLLMHLLKNLTMLQTSSPKRSWTRSWIKFRSQHARLAQQTGRCWCYLLHPGDPDTTQQWEREKDWWMVMWTGMNMKIWLWKHQCEKDISIWGEGEWRHQATRQGNLFNLNLVCTVHSHSVLHVFACTQLHAPWWFPCNQHNGTSQPISIQVFVLLLRYHKNTLYGI